MTDYGVVPTGFNRKPLAVIQAEIQASMIAQFGPQVIQTAASPFGQLNGMMTDLIAEIWELAEDVYQSYDPAQAEGTRLASLGKIRLLNRINGEQDEAFRRRITNSDLQRTELIALEGELLQLPGVTYARAFVNETEVAAAYGLPPHHVAVAVIGGNDQDIARIIRRQTVEGLPSWGKIYVETLVDGYMRTVFFTRPVEEPLLIDIYLSRSTSLRAPVIPKYSELKQTTLDALNGPDGLVNGETVTPARIGSLIYTPGVEVKEVRLARTGDLPTVRNIPFTFGELPKVTAGTLQLIWV